MCFTQVKWSTVKPNPAFYLISCALIQPIKRVVLPLHMKNLYIQNGHGWASLEQTACLLLLENIWFSFLRPVVAEIHPQAADFIPVPSAIHGGTVRCVHPTF